MKCTCNNCNSADSEIVYSAADSLRGLHVHLCNNCGLLQSFPRIDKVTDRERRVTSGAAWGNVRYGKGFRANFAIDFLNSTIKDFSPSRVLDVGANREVLF